MAKIDHVYKSVQILLNKNHFGVLTPDRFNELCRLAQNTLYSNLVNEKRLYTNRKGSYRGGQRKEEVDKALARYLVRKNITITNGVVDMPEDFGFFPDNNYLFTTSNREIASMGNDSFGYCFTPIVAPTELYPQHKVEGIQITVYPDTITEAIMMYYRTPKIPNWTSIVVAGQEDKPIFNDQDPDFQDVDVYEHRTEDLIIEIYKLAAAHIKDQLGVQVAEAEERSELNKETAV